MCDVLTNKLSETEKLQVIACESCGDVFIGDIVYMLKYNNHNVYRVFVDENGLCCFQCVQYACNVNGTEFYDESVDYWMGTVDFKYSDVETELYKTIMMCINSCELDGPFTIYE